MPDARPAPGVEGSAPTSMCGSGADWQPPRLANAPAWLRAEFEAYFADPSYRFQCAVELAGSDFQRRVWALIAAIPPGRPCTYGALARELGSSARAVGQACRANPVPLRIPCHRVVAANGLGGFAGDRGGRLLRIKRWLLAHEAEALAPSEAHR
ncbi:MAG: methylated-DNA--[protein]-cysteine S-methyltransferase [Halochromatium sp.]